MFLCIAIMNEERKTKVDLRYELEDYNNHNKKAVIVDLKDFKVQNKEEMSEVIDRLPESIRFKFRRMVILKIYYWLFFIICS